MTPIHVKVTRSKVKVTLAFNAKNMSAQYLEKFIGDSHYAWLEDWSWSVDGPYTFFRSVGQMSSHSSMLCKNHVRSIS